MPSNLQKEIIKHCHHTRTNLQISTTFIHPFQQKQIPIYKAALSSQTNLFWVKTVLKERSSGTLRLAPGAEMAPCPLYYAMT